ncbi:MAG: hypothetical protein DRO76_02210 [Candidatus Altiarchaeales archaeon]|nr:MAG: hypothetical protein DRO76_02210 [Candidatus Altiarchaeales archaeon]
MFQMDLIAEIKNMVDPYLVPCTLSIIKFLLIIIVGKILISLFLGYLKAYFKKSERLEETVEIFIYNIVSTISWAFILMIALGTIGIDITPIIAGFGVAGFVVGFALKDTLNNFVAGVMLIFYRPFKVGDVVKAAGITGKVTEIGISMSVLKTEDNLIVIIPNSKIWGAPITNYTRSDGFRC